MDTKSFFGENGLTSTSANHYANLAREQVRRIKSELDSIKFYNTSIRIIGEGTSAEVSFGVNGKNAFGQIRACLLNVAGYNSLIAFFMEAIKEKERLYKEAEKWLNEERRAEYMARREAHNENEPERGNYITAEDVVKSWSVGEQERYLSLEAQASVYGKFIHENGAFEKARKDLMNIIANPHSVSENGRDTIIYSFLPTVDVEDVEKFFYELQEQYRELQAELNGMKKRIDDAIRKHALETDNEYRRAKAEWAGTLKALIAEEDDIVAEETVKRRELCDEVQKLKIVVPHRLQGIFDELKKLG